MSPLGWVLTGAGAVWALGLVVACVVDRDNARLVAGFFLAAFAAPALATAEGLRRLGLFGSVHLDARALERFARLKHKGGGRALVLHYTPRLGVIWIRGLRDNEPEPPPQPIRVLSPEESAARRAAARADAGVVDHG